MAKPNKPAFKKKLWRSGWNYSVAVWVSEDKSCSPHFSEPCLSIWRKQSDCPGEYEHKTRLLAQDLALLHDLNTMATAWICRQEEKAAERHFRKREKVSCDVVDITTLANAVSL